jgi:transcriptional regulator with XRE-family HTH domain
MRIREYRLYANLSQMDLGERIGRDHKTVHKWEYGTSVPNLNDLLLIADACGIPVTTLLAPED